MKRMSLLNLYTRTGLFFLILSLGTVAALAAGETGGLALATLSSRPVQTLASSVHGDTLYAGVLDNPPSTTLYRSNDRGRTWENVTAGPGLITALAVHPAHETILFAGTAGGPVATSHNLWRSDDGGKTWRKFFLSLPAFPDGLIPAVTALAMDPNRPGSLYVGTDGHGIYQFDVGLDGLGYRRIGDVALAGAHIKALIIGPDGRVYALANNGFFATTPHGWQPIKSFPEIAVSLAVAPGAPQTLYAGGASNGAYRSIDGGLSWARISDGLEMAPGAALRVTSLAVDEQDPQHVVLATAYGLAGKLAGRSIYESHDAGHHWAKLADTSSIVTHLTFNRGVIYAVTANGLVRYGEPTEMLPVDSLPGLRPLLNPTVTQVLILVLTIALAGLVLVGRAPSTRWPWAWWRVWAALWER